VQQHLLTRLVLGQPQGLTLCVVLPWLELRDVTTTLCGQ
jgi:hypothetical protein